MTMCEDCETHEGLVIKHCHSCRFRRELPDTHAPTVVDARAGIHFVGCVGDKAHFVLTLDGGEGDVLIDRATWEDVARNMAWR